MRSRLVAWSFLAFIAIAAVGSGAAFGQNQPAPEWKAGIAQVNITPRQPLFMSGYGNRNKPFERVEADLFAHAVVLEDTTGRRAALVTSDILGLPASVAEPICERIQRSTGLKRDQILLNSVHTHTGPMISLDSSEREGLPGPEARKVAEYTRALQDRIVEVVEAAVKKLEPARLSLGSGVAPFVMNRREFTPNGVILGVNPRGPADRSVPVLRIDGTDGKPRAVLFGAAVHNTTLGGDCYEICGDYSGFAQQYVRARYPGAYAMFMLGCAGDANPYPRGGMAIAREHGDTLGKEVCRVLDGKLQPVRGPLRTAFGKAELPLQAPPGRAELEKQQAERGWRAGVARQMLTALDRGETLPRTYAAPLAVWQLGEDLTLVGLSGDVVVDYVYRIEQALGPNRLWIAAYCNDVFGYLPSARVLQEGGYETRGLYSGGLGYFAPEAEDVVVRKVRELAVSIGRKGSD
jgi:neutral ceramidase